MRLLSLALVLSSLWLLLSGHTEPMILGMGAISVVLVVWLSRRMALIDREGVPIDVTHRALPYSAWLMGEIIKSNVSLVPVLLAKEPSIQPQVIKLPAGGGSDLGRVTYANSITMTPGTVTLEIDEEEITVHALTDETARGLREGDMDRRAWKLGHAPTANDRTTSDGSDSSDSQDKADH